MKDTLCYCGSELLFEQCCKLLITKQTQAATPEALMRSRYSAYVIGDVKYLLDTTHPSVRKYHNKNDILAWATQNKWNRLEIVQSQGNYVSFKAYYTDAFGQEHTHVENSYFEKFASKWYFVEG